MKGSRAYNVAQLYNDGMLGQYSIGVASTASLGGGPTSGDLLQFRWTDSIRLGAIRRLSMSFARAAGAFVVGDIIKIQVEKATAWTVQGTGGTVVTLQSTPAGKHRTSMPNSLVVDGDFRICTTVVLGGGTKTNDPFPFRSYHIDPTQAVQTFDMLNYTPGDLDYPMVLGFQEGMSVRLVTENSAAGTFNMTFNVDWIEVDAR